MVALTNLTFGNASVKSYLASFPGFVEIMVNQLECHWENLRKATAHLFRNLAWKADKGSKSILAESKVVQVLLRERAKSLGPPPSPTAARTRSAPEGKRGLEAIAVQGSYLNNGLNL